MQWRVANIVDEPDLFSVISTGKENEGPFTTERAETCRTVGILILEILMLTKESCFYFRSFFNSLNSALNAS